MLKTQESREVVQLMTRKSDKNERGIRTRKVKRTVEAAYLGHPEGRYLTIWFYGCCWKHE